MVKDDIVYLVNLDTYDIVGYGHDVTYADFLGQKAEFDYDVLSHGHIGPAYNVNEIFDLYNSAARIPLTTIPPREQLIDRLWAELPGTLEELPYNPEDMDMATKKTPTTTSTKKAAPAKATKKTRTRTSLPEGAKFIVAADAKWPREGSMRFAYMELLKKARTADSFIAAAVKAGIKDKNGKAQTESDARAFLNWMFKEKLVVAETDLAA